MLHFRTKLGPSNYDGQSYSFDMFTSYVLRRTIVFTGEVSLTDLYGALELVFPIEATHMQR